MKKMAINYQKNKLTNILALVAQHITLLPIITTCFVHKNSDNEEASCILISGQVVNTLGLTAGLYIGMIFAGKHLINIGRPNLALGLTAFMPLAFLFTSFFIQVASFCINKGQNEKRDSFSMVKDWAIAGNPATWLLIPVTLAVDKGINSVINCCNKSTEMTTES
ncbi:MAG: hypothetical protein HRK26_03820 [Rickettsiaceae bacterium H1]|nr:hypothetical protein [Rickettsiaceae bacterium H1]